MRSLARPAERQQQKWTAAAMAMELLYTSAPRGLKPGAHGFCTVLLTAAMPRDLAARLELISGYRPLFPPGHPRWAESPVAHAHLHLRLGSATHTVLSRIQLYGLDHSNRPNTLAHHLVLDAHERAPGGPAAMLRAPEVMRCRWDGVPAVVPSASPAGIIGSATDVPPGPWGELDTEAGAAAAAARCPEWIKVTGSPRGALKLARRFSAAPDHRAYLIFEPGMELLPLLDEAAQLLPAALRWQVTFNTYFTTAPAAATCAWRGVAAGTREAAVARSARDAVVIDLTEAPSAGAPLS